MYSSVEKEDTRLMCRMASKKKGELRELNAMVLQFAVENVLIVDGVLYTRGLI